MAQRLPAQVWVGIGEPTAEGMTPFNFNDYPRCKPVGGMWTSTWDEHTGGGWVQWCVGEDFCVPADGWRAWRLTPRPDARVYEIDTYADLDALFARFPHESPHPALDGYPHWERIGEEFDAIHLTDAGQWATRLSHPLSLYGWDCESTLWYRWAFETAEDLGQRRFVLADDEEADA